MRVNMRVRILSLAIGCICLLTTATSVQADSLTTLPILIDSGQTITLVFNAFTLVGPTGPQSSITFAWDAHFQTLNDHDQFRVEIQDPPAPNIVL